LNGRWAPHDTRDEVVDFVAGWSAKTDISAQRFVGWLGIARGKFYSWKRRYGLANEHNGKIPRDHWLEESERGAIIDFQSKHPLNGYRRLAFMMLDADVAFVSPSTTYRVLKAAGLLDRWNRTPSKKGTGFVQPDRPHRHWHVDIAYINIAGTFYYLCTVLDGYSRAVVHWDIRESMKEADVELVIQRAAEKHPDARPRIISDNGPQFIARDFKTYIRLTGMTHVRTSPYYPQSNGKIERWHKTLKTTTIRPTAPETIEQAITVITKFVHGYNHDRLHSAIGYITPADKLAGREQAIWDERDRKLENAREARRLKRQQLRRAA
jgi:putative transposase